MYKELSHKIILIHIGLMLVIPSLAFYTFGSLSHGMIILSFILVFYIFFFNNEYFSIYFLKIVKFYHVYFGLIFLHFVIVGLANSNVNFSRFFYSYFSLILFTLGASLFAVILINENRKNKLKKLFKIIFYLIILLTFLNFLRFSEISPFYYKTNIYLTIYAEPSHFIMSILPFIFYFLISEKNTSNKLYFLLFFFIIAILVKSAMLMVALIFCLFLIFSLKLLLLSLFIILFIFLIVFSLGFIDQLNFLIDTVYFKERFFLKTQINESKPNMSVLVFLANYHEIYLNLMKTFFFGIGFQQLGYTGEMSFFREIIFNSSGYFEYTSNKDASFLAGKIVSEFGIMGILFLFFYFLVFIKNFLIINKKKLKKNHDIQLFFSSCILSFLIELFIRGAGYFTVSTFLFITSIFGQALLFKNEKNN